MAEGLSPYHASLEYVVAWLTRIAAGHGLPLQAFAMAALGGPLWNIDIDAFAADDLLHAISIGTGVADERVREATLTTLMSNQGMGVRAHFHW